jgi:hypothetical protein
VGGKFGAFGKQPCAVQLLALLRCGRELHQDPLSCSLMLCGFASTHIILIFKCMVEANVLEGYEHCVLSIVRCSRVTLMAS